MRTLTPTSSRQQKSAHHINSLDGLRGTAFLMVFFYHYGISSHVHGGLIGVIAWCAGWGWMGVDLFFVLSGFLITGILLDTREDPNYFKNFYARRSLRIFPLFYGVLFVLLLLTPFLHLEWKPGHIAYFFYLGNIAGHVNPSLNEVLPAVSLTHTWSLAVEEQFYLIWPFVVYQIRDRRKLLNACMVMIVLSLLLRVALIQISPQSGFEWSYGELPTHCDGLLFGALAAILIRPGASSVALATLVRRTRIPLLAALLGIAAIVWHDGTMNNHKSWMTIVGFPLLAITFTSILLRTVQPGTTFSWLGQRRILRFFGKYSYGMYIYHVLFWRVVAELLVVLQERMHSMALGGIAFVLIVLAGTSIVSVLSYEIYEKPWLKLKSRFAYQKAAVKQTA